MTKTFLHVGCGQSYKSQTTSVFNTAEWNEVRLDIDPNCHPDITCSMYDMDTIEDNTYDAIYSSHNIEHVFPHEVIDTLIEFRRVLKDDGFLILTCPDIKAVCERIGEGKISERLYNSPAGDIYPLDILYGHRSSIASGHEHMAHKNGFTSESLQAHITKSNYKSFIVGEAKSSFALWLMAYKNVIVSKPVMERDLKCHILKPSKDNDG